MLLSAEKSSLIAKPPDLRRGLARRSLKGLLTNSARKPAAKRPMIHDKCDDRVTRGSVTLP